jgi:hypothetical protein
MKVKENTNSFLCIELIFKEVIIRNYAKSNVQVFMNVLSKYTFAFNFFVRINDI